MKRRAGTQDVSWFLDQAASNQLELNPPFQRRSVWTVKDRRFFLDTIFNDYPCPAIFLRKCMNKDGRSAYEVVDGKQRLETILLFTKGGLSLASEPASRLSGKKWSDLSDADRRIFWNYVLPVELLDFADDAANAVNEAFDRLNRNSRKLEAQELRHARYDGWFISVVERECLDPIWRSLGIVTTARSKRMKDAQFLSELLLVLIEKRQSGFDQDHLNQAYADYDDADEEGATLDPDEVDEQLRCAKQVLTEMNDVNGCVRSAAATVGAFYTLWSAIALHRSELPEPTAFAERYAEFVELATKLKDVDIAFTAAEGDSRTKLAWKYANSLRGAHTDLTPRATRLECLMEAMRGA